MQNRVAVIIIGNGRLEYLKQCWESFKRNVCGNIVFIGMVNDFGNAEYSELITNMFETDKTVNHEKNLGAVEAIRSGRSIVPEDVDYVFWVEEDFIFDRFVDLNKMITILENDLSLVQVSLKRQAVNHEERIAGGFIEQHPDWYEQIDGDIPYVKHQVCFTNNPCLFPKWLLRYPVPDPPNSEGMYGIGLRDMGYHFAILGKKNDDPMVRHIGEVRIGGGF